jgi:hypothetical protein
MHLAYVRDLSVVGPLLAADCVHLIHPEWSFLLLLSSLFFFFFRALKKKMPWMNRPKVAPFSGIPLIENAQ